MKLKLTDRHGNKINLDTTLHGYSYRRKKEAARDLAIDFQHALSSSDFCPSYSQLAVIGDIFTTIGKRYGLLQEFRENGIC